MSGVPTSKIVLIGGPTASGKSALALRLAERIGGAVINADSMQVYRELRIITARPVDGDLARAPHFLYGQFPAREAYSAGRFVVDAAAAIAAARAIDLVPILVGGTGLYFKAILEGLSPIPAADPVIRAYWRAQAEVSGAGALHEILRQRDAATAARLARGDAQRIVRALEVLDSTGRTLSDWQREKSEPVAPESQTVRLFLNPQRQLLHARTDARIDAMIADGALDEASALAALGLDAALPAMRAIGVAPFIAAARGDVTEDAAKDAVKIETRQYVKRQQTWLSRNMYAWKCVLAHEMESIVEEYIAFIQS